MYSNFIQPLRFKNIKCRCLPEIKLNHQLLADDRIFFVIPQKSCKRCPHKISVIQLNCKSQKRVSITVCECRSPEMRLFK